MLHCKKKKLKQYTCMPEQASYDFETGLSMHISVFLTHFYAYSIHCTKSGPQWAWCVTYMISDKYSTYITYSKYTYKYIQVYVHLRAHTWSHANRQLKVQPVDSYITRYSIIHLCKLQIDAYWYMIQRSSFQYSNVNEKLILLWQ